jgi:hypothetical protein
MKIEVIEELPLKFGGAQVRAASALVPFWDGFLIAQDDANHAMFLRNGSLQAVRLFADTHGDTYSKETHNKQWKPDLECGLRFHWSAEAICGLFGSGSTDQRRRAARIRGTAENPEVSIVDVSALYAAAARVLELPDEEFNLEGACVLGDRARFFQRGNGKLGINAIFDVTLESLGALLDDKGWRGSILDPKRIELGRLDGALLGFSDATELSNTELLFAASADQSASTYDDGACAGSIVGRMDSAGRILDTAVVPGPRGAPPKVEGIAIKSIRRLRKIKFLLHAPFGLMT